MQMLIVMHEKGGSFFAITKKKSLVSAYIEQEISFLFIQL